MVVQTGIDGLIVMPETAPFVKVAATKRFGAKVMQAGRSFEEAYVAAKAVAEKEGRTFIHAFNDAAVVAGQGTVAMELMEQNPYLDAVVVPIGGGGLIAGMALAFKKLNPRIKIYGVEAAAMPGMYKSVLSGQVTSVAKSKTMADGIAIENIGAVPYSVIKSLVDEIVLVDEDEVRGCRRVSPPPPPPSPPPRRSLSLSPPAHSCKCIRSHAPLSLFFFFVALWGGPVLADCVGHFDAIGGGKDDCRRQWGVRLGRHHEQKARRPGQERVHFDDWRQH